MAQPHVAPTAKFQPVEPASTRSHWTGWVTFAGVMMAVLGLFNIIDGLVALFNNDFLAVTQSGLLVFNYTAWGWFLLGFGAATLFAGFAVMAGKTWGLVVGIIVVGLNAVAQLSYMSAYPVWSITILIVDFIVIYALTAHGSELREV